MIEYAKGVAAKVPVRLQDSSGVGKTGVLYTDVTVTIYKSGGTTENLNLTGADWSELAVGAFTNTGTYQLALSASDLDTVGEFMYAVSSLGVQTYIGVIEVVDRRPFATFTSGGESVTPTITSVSAPQRNQVIVTFSEPVVMTTGSNGALNPVNYGIEGLAITAVTSKGDRTVLLTTSNQAAGVNYTLAVSNIEDLNGNVVG